MATGSYNEKVRIVWQNGSTVIVNTRSIARSLGREEDEVATMFRLFRRCKSSKTAKGSLELVGHFTSDQLETDLERYTEWFVRCHRCNKPKTWYVQRTSSQPGSHPTVDIMCQLCCTSHTFSSDSEEMSNLVKYINSR